MGEAGQTIRAMLLLLAAGTILLAAPQADAQNTEQRRQIEPQQLDDRFRDQDRERERGGDAPATAIDRGQAEAVAERTFVITAVTIAGVTVYPASTFVPLYEPLLATTLDEARIAALADIIASRYHDDGYVLARAVVRPQDLAFGRLHIDVIEGYVSTVTVRDREGRPVESPVIAGYAERLKAPRPFTRDVLERYVTLIDDLPGLAVGANLRPVGEDGAHELIVTLQREDYATRIAADNRGTRSVGRWIASGNLTANNRMGREESINLRLATVPNETHELRFINLQFEEAVGDDGLVLGFGGWHSDIAAGHTLKAFDVDSTENRFAAWARYPLVRGRNASWFAHANLELRNSEEYVGNQNTFDDRIRSLRLGTSGYLKDGWDGETVGNIWVSSGLDLMEASPRDSTQLSRTGGRSDYRKISAYLSRFQPLHDLWSVRVAANGQYAFRNLLSAEEYRLGGGGFGRGYDSSELSGEHGVAGLFEIRHNLQIEEPGFNWGHFYAFYDGGAVWTEAPGSAPTRFSLASTGVGLRSGVLDNARLEVELARPLTRRPFNEDDENWRLFLGLTLYY